MNTFGYNLRLTTFGESHGPAIGGIIDGLPSGLHINQARVGDMMAARRPGSSPLSSSRREPDTPEWLSGISPEGITYGTPIGFIIRNTDARPADYPEGTLRPSHADLTWRLRHGEPHPLTGGGRASARETACRVAAGAIALQALEQLAPGTAIETAVLYPTPDEIEHARAELDTLGATVRCTISGFPAGMGNPVFGKLSARLADAMMSIPAAKAFEIGMGAEGCRKRGSEVIDEFAADDATGRIVTSTNHSGGIQGGISNGMPIILTVHFKPIATLPRPVATVTTDSRPTTITMAGRHDPSVAARVAPVVTAMAALTLLDALLSPR